MCRIRSRCYACDVSGHAAAAPPMSVMNSRRFTAKYLPCSRPKGSHTSATAGHRCAAGLRSGLCQLRVKLRSLDVRPGKSALPTITDIVRQARQVRKVPKPDVLSESLVGPI
jgi:hypothetical protein